MTLDNHSLERLRILGVAGCSNKVIPASMHVTARRKDSLYCEAWHIMIRRPCMVPLKALMLGFGARMRVGSTCRNWMQPSAGLPRVFSYLGKRVLPRRFRDSAAQALELPQHNSGACTDATNFHLLTPLPPLHSHRSDKQTG